MPFLVSGHLVQRRDWLVNYIAIIVTTIWAVTLVVGMINPNYTPPVAIYPALLAVVGGVFGFKLTKREDTNENE